MEVRTLWAGTLIVALGLVSGASAQEFDFPPSPPGFNDAGGSDQAITITESQWNELMRRLEAAETANRETRSAIEALPPVGNVNDTADDAVADVDLPPADQGAASAMANTKPEAPQFPKVKLTGFMHIDAGYFNQDAESRALLGDIQDGVDIRRARLQAVGSVTEFTNYSLEMDFGQAGRPSFQDVWLEQTNLPFFGNLRIGQFRQPISMDSLTPIRQLTFLERSTPFQAFDPFRRVGIMAYDKSDDQMTAWQYSGYKTGGFNNAPLGDGRVATDIGDVGGYSFAARMTHLLHYDEPAEGRYLLHVGGNFNYSRITQNDFNGPAFYDSRAIPEFFVGDPAGTNPPATGTPFIVDTGRITADDFLIYGVELAAQNGPLHFQSEYLITTVNQVGGEQLFFDGAYAELGYFLTGENRTYNRTFGTFDRVTPYEDFFSLKRGGVCGWGAWEVAGRLSYLDLTDPAAMTQASFEGRPGTLTQTTLGLNWYWNAYTKMQFNYIHSQFDNVATGDSELDIFAVRWQLEF